MRLAATTDVFLNSSSDLLPWFEGHRAGLNRGNATFDFSVPGAFRIGVGRTLETRKEFSNPTVRS
jgi:hypothetical protein